MEIFYMILFCVLFTTTISFSSVDSIAEYAQDSLVLFAQDRTDCSCENGRCFTDKEGRTKCACKPEFALQDEFTCKRCDCGSLGKCIFALKPTYGDQLQYQKQCVCDAGCAEKDGICVDCFCGDNSACDFVNGERRCFCLDGYSEKNGVCTRCDCGFYGICEYQNGNKECDCNDGYSELNGTCEECDCGEYGMCTFTNGQKTCWCQQGFLMNKGKCEPCDCGSNSEYCGFVNGVKQCKCKDKYADRYGTCEECYCGAYSSSCSFNNNQKTCSCLEGYAQKGEMCQLGCNVEHPCQNGGYCKEGFCFCLNGTRGGFCEVIEECSPLCPDQKNIKCSYDIAFQRTYCRCLDSDLSYDPDMKQCRGTCETDRQCVNGRCHNGVCQCLPGTWGDRCEIVDCETGAITCTKKNFLWKSDTLYLLWKGSDTLYLLSKRGGILKKFENQDIVLKYVEDTYARPLQCNQSYDVFWSENIGAVFVRTSQNEVLRYQLIDSSGARCSINI